MSGPAGFYSRNPANEVIQGTEQKVRNGRTLNAGTTRFLCVCRPMRNKSASSAASRTSFFTRRYANPFTPNGCARCTWAPASASTSAAQ